MRWAIFLFIGIFISLSLAQFAGVPHLFTIFVYYTLYHHIRQFYGLTKWYEKINKVSSKWRPRFLWALTLMPLVIFHLRPETQSVLQEFSLLQLPNHVFWLSPLRIVYYLIIALWVAFEIKNFLINKQHLPSIMLMAQVVLAHFVSLNLVQNIELVAFPLLVAHGFTYFALINNANIRLQKMSLKKSIWALAAVAFIFGGIDFVLSDYLDYGESFSLSQKVVMSVVVGLVLTPNVWHYLVDAKIWKKTDPDMELLSS